jgi:hypothetical protein
MRQRILLLVGLAAGLALAYVDSPPTWDNSGTLAGGILLTAGLLTLLGCRRPWLMALVVGLWIPLLGIYRSGDLRLLLVLLFPLAGAYIGWGIRLGLSKAVHWAQP